MALSWFRRELLCPGAVLFRGTLPPKPDELDFPEAVRVRSKEPAPENCHWSLEVEHAEWGCATVSAPRDNLLPPREIIDFSTSLTREECDLAAAAGSLLAVTVQGSKGHVLRDRKNLLRFLRLVMGDDGLVALDVTPQRFWSRADLDQELAHDADLDVIAVSSVHVVTGDDSNEPVWLHTHGLAELGAFDFDILRPSEDLFGTARDTVRALEYACLEGEVSPSTARFTIARPRGGIRFVPAREFHERAAPADAALRSLDESHTEKRSVLCQPAKGLFGRWKSGVRPSRFLSGPIPDGTLFHFSTPASDLMAERAKNTYGVLREMREEFARFEVQSAVKLGIRVDGGGPNDKEHIWFSVNEFGKDTIDATVENKPIRVSGLQYQQRGRHAIELLSDWILLTPAGPITPREFRPARVLREKGEELLELLAQFKAADVPA